MYLGKGLRKGMGKGRLLPFKLVSAMLKRREIELKRKGSSDTEQRGR